MAGGTHFAAGSTKLPKQADEKIGRWLKNDKDDDAQQCARSNIVLLKPVRAMELCFKFSRGLGIGEDGKINTSLMNPLVLAWADMSRERKLLFRLRPYHAYSGRGVSKYVYTVYLFRYLAV